MQQFSDTDTPFIDRNFITFKEAITYARNQGYAFNYQTISIAAAIDNKMFSVSGNFFYIWAATDATANINVKFNHTSNAINLVKQTGLKFPFENFRISCDAQAGKSITIVTGNLLPGLIDIIDNRNVVSDVMSDVYDELVLHKALLTSIDDDVNTSRKIQHGEIGTQILKQATLSGAGTTIIHTVTADKTLYLTHLAYDGQSGAAGSCKVIIRNVADATVMTWDLSLVAANLRGGHDVNLSGHPVVIATGFDVCIVGAASNAIRASIVGWEE